LGIGPTRRAAARRPARAERGFRASAVDVSANVEGQQSQTGRRKHLRCPGFRDPTLLRARLQTLPDLLEPAKALNNAAMDGLISLRVARKWPVANDVLAFELTAHGVGMLPEFEAGAHIEVEVLGLDSGFFRTYSLCNAPHETHRYVIAVKRERAGKGGAAWLHEKLQAGHVVQSSLPINNFPLDRAAIHSVLLAGGIGIAPLLSMAEDLHRRAASFELHHSARNNQLTAFVQTLTASSWRHKLCGHWSEYTGGHIDFKKTFATLPRLSHLYICGPSRYMEAALSAARSAGLQQSNLHFESFD
jgi:vanillate monooxygenase ferredoxin subunit